MVIELDKFSSSFFTDVSLSNELNATIKDASNSCFELSNLFRCTDSQ